MNILDISSGIGLLRAALIALSLVIAIPYGALAQVPGQLVGSVIEDDLEESVEDGLGHGVYDSHENEEQYEREQQPQE